MAEPKKTGGRKKGTPNKATAQARELIGQLVDANMGRVQRALNRLEKRDPEAFLSAFLRLVEFHVPKLARAELSGPDGRDLTFRSTIDFGG